MMNEFKLIFKGKTIDKEMMDKIYELIDNIIDKISDCFTLTNSINKNECMIAIHSDNESMGMDLISVLDTLSLEYDLLSL